MELRHYLTIIRRWLWLILLSTVLAAVAAYVASRFTQPIYQASVTLLIDEGAGGESSDYQDILASERLARTYAELLTKRPVLEEVITRLELRTTPDDLEKAVEVQSVRDTQLIELSVEDPNPVRAVEIANAIPEVFQEQNTALQTSRFASSKESLANQLDTLNQQIAQTEAAIDGLGTPTTPEQEAELARLESSLVEYRQSYTTLLQSYEELRIAEAQSISNVVVVQPAAPEDEPVRPRPALNTALAATVGLMLSLGVVSLVEYADDSLKTPEQITETLNLPIVGVIARMADDEVSKGPVADVEPRSPVTEAYRALRTNVEFAGLDRPLKTILVTSPGPREGKSITAANLAIVLAQTGKQVVLLDCDMRRPTAHRLFGFPNRLGLSDLILQPPTQKDGVLQATEVDNLGLVTTGPLPPNPAEMVSSQRMLAILDHLKSQADVVVVDSPPVMAVTDAVILAGRTDGVLLVIDAGKTRIAAARQAIMQLRRADANLIGVVVNKVTAKHSEYYYNYYYYRTYGNGVQPNGKGVLHRIGTGSLRKKLGGKEESQPDGTEESTAS